jgi:hypothetical protein
MRVLASGMRWDGSLKVRSFVYGVHEILAVKVTGVKCVGASGAVTDVGADREGPFTRI